MKKIIAITSIIFVASLVGTSSLAAYADNNHSYVPNVKIKEGTSTNWSGYVVQNTLSSPSSGFVKSVSGKWIVPTLDCSTTPNTYSSMWVGIDGNTDNTVEQTGTESDCRGTTQVNSAWFELFPKLSHTVIKMTVNTGDQMSASVTFNGNDRYAVTITDVTTGKSFSKNMMFKPSGSSAQRSSAEWILEAPSSLFTILPLADFGTATFSGCTFTDSIGVTHAIDDLGSTTFDSITMTDTSGGVSTPSGLSDSGGSSSFSLSYSP